MKLRTLLREVSQKINIGTKNRDEFDDLFEFLYENKIRHKIIHEEDGSFVIMVFVDDLINIVGDNFQSSLKGDFPGISFY